MYKFLKYAGLLAAFPCAVHGQTIPNLPAASSVNSSDLVAVSQSSTTKNATAAQVVAGGASGVYAPLASPALTGTPSAPTPTTSDNTTKIATTAYVQNQGYLTSAAATSTYAPFASPTLTGTPVAPTASYGANTTQLATTAYVQQMLGSMSSAPLITSGAAYTATAYNQFLEPTGSPGSVTLLTASGKAGAVYAFWNNTSGSEPIYAGGSSVFAGPYSNGTATVTLTSGATMTIISDGLNWYITTRSDVIPLLGANNTFTGNNTYTGKAYANYMTSAYNQVRSNTQLTYNAVDPYPYDVNFDFRSYVLAGQSSASTGSTVNFSGYTNWYNVSNGPGVTITCTATNGSNILTSCSPNPTTVNPASPVGETYVFVGPANGAAISSGTGGLSAGAQVTSIGSGTMMLTTGAGGTSSPWTGGTGTVAFTVVSGRAELNNHSFASFPIGTEAGSGPMGGTNWYNDIMMGSPIGANQEGFLSAEEFIVTKTSQGNGLDLLHNGSQGINVTMLPTGAGNSTNTTYPVNDGIAVQGWSGTSSTFGTGGQAVGATYGAYNGIRIGGGCQAVYCNSSMRSYFSNGLDIEDYATNGINIQSPHSGSSPNAINIAPGAGNINLAQSLYAGTGVFSGNSSISGVVLTLQNVAGTCTLTPTSTTATFSCSSDARLKSEIVDAPDQLGFLNSLRVRSYKIDATGERTVGPIAQELKATHPEMVHEVDDDLVPDEKANTQGTMLAVDGVNPWSMVKAIQELSAREAADHREIMRLRRQVVILAKQLKHRH